MAIARSLLGEPKVVILDEPTAALGVAQTAQVLDLVERLRDRDSACSSSATTWPTSSPSPTAWSFCGSARTPASFTVDEPTIEEIVAAITGASDNVVTRRAERRKAAAEGEEEQ